MQGAADDAAAETLQQRVEALERQLAEEREREEQLRQQVAHLAQQVEHAQVNIIACKSTKPGNNEIS